MQNEQTLIELGFKETPRGFLYTGKNISFMALVQKSNGPVYVELFYISDKIDKRPLSNTLGQHLLGRIKDCCSNGSVEKAINKFDIKADGL
jgi:hypothetical protein